jgi:hypothetical protein
MFKASIKILDVLTSDPNTHLCLVSRLSQQPMSVVGIETWLRAGQSGIRIQARARYVSLRRNVKAGSGAHPTSYSMSTGVRYRG